MAKHTAKPPAPKIAKVNLQLGPTPSPPGSRLKAKKATGAKPRKL